MSISTERMTAEVLSNSEQVENTFEVTCTGCE